MMVKCITKYLHCVQWCYQVGLYKITRLYIIIVLSLLVDFELEWQAFNLLDLSQRYTVLTIQTMNIVVFINYLG